MIKPERLNKGDAVGLVCPAGPVAESLLYSGIRVLEGMGLKVTVGEHVLDREDYLAGEDRHRASDLNNMFKNPDIKAIFCARGGYGTTRILDMIDYDIITDNPKILVGYSDITALHIAIWKKTGLVTFHGPMTAEMGHDFPEYNRLYFNKLLFGGCSSVQVENPTGEQGIKVLMPGSAAGPVTGGNLSLLCSALGTQYEIDTKGCIFFIEEIGEPPHKIDRMLNHLKMAGKFRDASAIVFGQWTRCTDPLHKGYSVDKIIREIAYETGKPCIANVMIGHGTYNITIPLGCNTLIEDGRLYFTESGVM